ncbi:Transcription factor tau 55 kDa subunit [Ophiocordyceps camponoti-floridani]|uniref:Transcription factor tau 55 kDa subunit n=1 Tax=Ophiocordyceps camponoti-floridani TaxID=2030778 RepID=A0A8H4Q1E5_9HYPO|nr:Transcription factor tau 55 kDa subunit [Ophiocordyceps camponoti-floridani]
MSLEAIYVVRHGFRSNWLVDPATGVYTSYIPSPTSIAADPALTSHGVRQAEELAAHLSTLEPPIEAVYSSPFYRCLQTVDPFVRLQGPRRPLERTGGAARGIRLEHGIREWFGAAPFRHPTPAPPELLSDLFPAVDSGYQSAVVPDERGETLAQLQERVATTLRALIRRSDAEGVRAVVLCTHAAVVIVMGRVLTACVPQTVDARDFHAYTCGLTVFRRHRHQDSHADETAASLVGGWRCVLDSDCSFLSGGQERGWRFSGDESFPGMESDSHEHGQHKL